MSDSTTNLDLISQSQAQKEVTANALFDSFSPATFYGRRASTCVGLTWGYYGGNIVIGGTITPVANGTITLTANATNYVEYDPATGTVHVNQSSFTGGRTPLYQIVCNATDATSWIDKRASLAGPAGADGSNGVDGVNGAGANAKLYYFQDVSSDLAGFEKLLDAPIPGTEQDDSKSVTNSANVLIEKYVTEAGNPGVTSIPAGLWTFRYWGSVNSIGAGTICYLVFEVWLHTSDSPTEHLLFSAQSVPLTTTPTQYALDYTELVSHSCEVTDRLIVKVYAKNSSATSRTVHFFHDGTVHNSQVQTPITQGTVAQPYDIGSTYNGVPAASTAMLRVPIVRKVVFPVGLTGSKGVLGVAATAQTDFDIQKNGSSFGTMRFAISGTVATFIAAAQTTFAAGDVLTVISPGTPDATAANLGFCLTGTR